MGTMDDASNSYVLSTTTCPVNTEMRITDIGKPLLINEILAKR